MKKASGITLVTLAITIVIMILILGATLNLGVENLRIKNLNNMYTDIKSLNDNISTYYNKYGTIPIKEKFTGSYEFQSVKNPNDDPDGYYVIDINKIENILLTRNLTWTDNDVYIINTKTHTIYYPEGVSFEGDVYYRLPGDYSEI